jgi:CRP/FNR family transcriptional regulator
MVNVEKIKNLSLFDGLQKDHLTAISRIVTHLAYHRGEIVFMEGDEADGFYIVETGQVKIYKISAEGKEQILHLFGPGESFGEVAVFTGQGFPAYAKANINTTCFFIPRSDFVDMIRLDPTVAMNLLGVMSLRLMKFTRLIEDLSLKEVPGRLAAYLLYLSESSPDPQHLTLTVSKGQLAALLGTIPETLSRILTKMARLGYLKSEGPRIRILNRGVLEGIAEGDMKMT